MNISRASVGTRRLAPSDSAARVCSSAAVVDPAGDAAVLEERKLPAELVLRASDHGRDRDRLFVAERVVDRGEESSVEAFDEDVERSAACQTHAPGRVVRDAVVQELGLSARERLLPGLDDSVLDAPPGDRAGDPAVGSERHLAAGGPRRRAPGLDDRGDRDLPALGLPALDVGEDVAHAEGDYDFCSRSSSSRIG